MSRVTTDRNDPGLGFGANEAPAPQNEAYLVLPKSEEFVRPLRNSYVHLTCGLRTTMSKSIAETYAQNPSFYGATYCCGCRKHLPVGENGEFVWVEAGAETNIKVGT